MKQQPSRLLLLLFALHTHCAPGLDALANVQLQLRPDSANPQQFLLVLQHSGCVTLGDVTATMNGAPLELRARGGPRGGILGGCAMPTFATTASVPRSENTATIVLTDGTKTFRMTVQNLFAEHRTELLDPNTPLLPGAQRTLRWIPNTDRFDPMLRGGYDLHFLCDGGDQAFALREASALRIEGEQIQFTVPTSMHTPCNGFLALNGAARAGVSLCEGAASCDAEIELLDSRGTRTRFGN